MGWRSEVGQLVVGEGWRSDDTSSEWNYGRQVIAILACRNVLCECNKLSQKCDPIWPHSISWMGRICYRFESLLSCSLYIISIQLQSEPLKHTEISEVFECSLDVEWSGERPLGDKSAMRNPSFLVCVHWQNFKNHVWSNALHKYKRI